MLLSRPITLIYTLVTYVPCVPQPSIGVAHEVCHSQLLVSQSSRETVSYTCRALSTVCCRQLLLAQPTIGVVVSCWCCSKHLVPHVDSGNWFHLWCWPLICRMASIYCYCSLAQSHPAAVVNHLLCLRHVMVLLTSCSAATALPLSFHSGSPSLLLALSLVMRAPNEYDLFYFRWFGIVARKLTEGWQLWVFIGPCIIWVSDDVLWCEGYKHAV